MTFRKYLVRDVQDEVRSSHLSYLFPRCVYALQREEDGTAVRLSLPKSLGWRVGQIVELSDATIETARNF